MTRPQGPPHVSRVVRSAGERGRAMTTEDDLLRALCEAPDDDAPRLVYADWLEEHGRLMRAELIRAQVELATLAGDTPRRRALAFRCRCLVDEHEHKGLGPPRPPAAETRWRRGFVE